MAQARLNGWVSALPTGDPDGAGLEMQIGALYFSWGREGAVRQGRYRSRDWMQPRRKPEHMPLEHLV